MPIVGLLPGVGRLVINGETQVAWLGACSSLSVL